MKIIDCIQKTPEWEACRLGRPTASQVDRILTPKTLKPSTSATTYRNQLVAEYLLGHPIDWNNASGFMDRGTNMEAEALAFFELQQDVEVQKVGFVLRDDERFGGSPDGLVGDDGIVEIKCPAIHTHIGYLVDPTALLDNYRGQTQAYMYLTDRSWCTLLAYSPVLPSVQVRIERDDKYIGALDAALEAFCDNLDAVKEQLMIRVVQ